MIDDNTAVIVTALRDRFGLTPAETRLALRIAACDTLRSSACALDITYETARNTLKRIFWKTGVRRQTELVILCIRSIAK
jgi:DNA-binding CsgD family transcriptional regulator